MKKYNHQLGSYRYNLDNESSIDITVGRRDNISYNLDELKFYKFKSNVKSNIINLFALKYFKYKCLEQGFMTIKKPI